MTPMDPYSVLGVAPSAGADEVKSAYRARSRLLHPDVHRDAQGHSPQAAHEAFTQLCSAYELALGNLDRTRRTLATVGETATRTAPAPRPVSRPAARPVRSAGPAVATAGGTVSAGALDGFDWRGTMLLVGLAVLGLLFVTDWLPALLAYSSL